MNTTYKRLALAFGAGLGMSLVVWLFVSESSPAYRYLLEQPGAGYSLLLLDLPALFVSRLVSGSPPAPIVVYVACFVQWFVLGLVLSFFVWRNQHPGE